MSKFFRSNVNDNYQISVRRPLIKRENKPENKFKYIKKDSFIKDSNSEKWVKVIFSKGSNFELEWIKQELEKAVSNRNEIFQIYNHRVAGDSCVVFVKLNKSLHDFKKNCSSIPHPISGYQCDMTIVQVTEPETPNQLNDHWNNIMQQVLSSRYNATNKHLDLSSFSEDPLFKRNGLWATLRRPIIISTITKLFQSISNIEIISLDLSNNRLAHLFNWSTFFQTFPIQILDLSNNSLYYTSLLKSIKSAKKLIILKLENDSGTCSVEMKNWSKFVGELTDSCQSLQQVNNKSVGYDVTKTNIRLPATITTLTDSQNTLLVFFNEYSNKVDFDRAELSSYYTSDSVLTINVFYHDDTQNNRRLGEVYLKNNRSIDKLKDETRRQQFIKRGSTQILGFYSELPEMRHISDSQIVDSIVDSVSCKIFSVQGIYVEFIKITKNKQNSSNSSQNTHFVYNMRLFNRSFIVVPPGNIIQENWTVTNPTDELFRKYRNQFENLRSSIAADSKSESLMNSASSFSSKIPQQVQRDVMIMTPQQKLIQEFSNFSGMNLNYSQQCLQETDWNVEHAKQAFQTALANNQIPQEAFVK